MSQFQGKAVLTIYAPTKANPLTQKDIMVWSYIFFQASFNTKPSYRKTSAKTGILEETVSAICANLKAFGLIDESGLAVLPDKHRDMFKEKASTGDHLSQKLAFSQTYVRNLSLKNPLGVAAIATYSFLRNKFAAGFAPSGGWNKDYLARCIHVNGETITSSLAKLHEHGLIVYQAKPFSVKMYETVSAENLNFFADKKRFREADADQTDMFGFIKSDPTEAPAMPTSVESSVAQKPFDGYTDDGFKRQKDRALAHLRQHLVGEEYEDQIKAAIEGLVPKHPVYESAYNQELVSGIRNTEARLRKTPVHVSEGTCGELESAGRKMNAKD